jgi:hypothetical protein
MTIVSTFRVRGIAVAVYLIFVGLFGLNGVYHIIK